MKAIVLKAYYDIATQTTYRKGAELELSKDEQSEKLIAAGLIKVEESKAPAKKQAPRK